MDQIKILLVDDEEDFVQTLSDRMGLKNLSSEFVLSGEQALQSLGNDIPDVMVLDLKMPGINGWDVLRHVKKNYPSVQVIILTGQGTEQDRAKSFDLGAFDYFAKPVDIDALIQSIKNAYRSNAGKHESGSRNESDKFSTVKLDQPTSALREKVSDLSDKMERIQEAITFAEADEHRYAEQALQKKPVKETPGKLVVVGNESEFSEDIIEYALEMAQRMAFEIVALNSAPLTSKTFKLFSTTWKNVCEEFHNHSVKNVVAFQKKAEEAGIAFFHVIEYVEIDDALKKLRSKFSGINLVVSKPDLPEEVKAANIGKEPSAKRPGFLVYAVS